MHHATPGEQVDSHQYDLDFDLSRDDMRRLLEHTWQNSKEFHEGIRTFRKAIRQWTGIAVVTSVGLLVYVWLHPQTFTSLKESVTTIAWMTVVVFLWYQIYQWRKQGSAQAMLASKEQTLASKAVEYCLGRQRLQVTADSVRFQSTYFDTVQRWNGLERIDHVNGDVYLVRPDARIFIIPARALEGTDPQQFIQHCRRWHEAALAFTSAPAQAPVAQGAPTPLC